MGLEVNRFRLLGTIFLINYLIFIQFVYNIVSESPPTIQVCVPNELVSQNIKTPVLGEKKKKVVGVFFYYYYYLSKARLQEYKISQVHLSQKQKQGVFMKLVGTGGEVPGN